MRSPDLLSPPKDLTFKPISPDVDFFNFNAVFKSTIGDVLKHPLVDGYINWWAMSLLLPHKEVEAKRQTVLQCIRQLLQHSTGMTFAILSF